MKKRTKKSHRHALLRAARLQRRRDKRSKRIAWQYEARARRLKKARDKSVDSSHYHVVRLWGDIRVLDHPRDALVKLSKLMHVPSEDGQQLAVQVVMDNLRAVDAAAILIICSRIVWLREVLGARVEGSYPTSHELRRVLSHVGFGNFLRHVHRKGTHALTIHRGQDAVVDTRLAGELRNFLTEQDLDFTTEEADRVYWVVMECLENVRQHAYPGNSGGGSEYYVVGMSDVATGTATVAILDMGVGIAKSISRNASFLEFAVDSFRSTATLLSAVTQGRRTESRDRHRGRGLNSLREFACASSRRRFHVISSGAMVSWSSEGLVACSVGQFLGTVVCLEMTASRMEPE